MKKLFFHIIFITLISSHLSCEKNISHNYSEIDKTIPEISKIQVYDDINLVLHPDTLYLSKIIAPEELIDNIHIDTLENYLVLNNLNKPNWKFYGDSVVVHLYCGNKVNRIETNGTGYIRNTETLIVTNITTYVYNGAGEINLKINSKTLSIPCHQYTTTDVHISGTTENITAYFKGKGKAMLKNLHAKNATVIYEGTNEFYLNVTGLLKVNILNSGNIYYTGNPDSIIIEKTGTGNLVKLD